jgi:hypothetical protein
MRLEEILASALSKVNVEEIFSKQIENTVERLASELLSSHGEFGTIIKDKLKKDLEFDVNAISVPQFSSLAINAVESTLKQVEMKEKEKIEKDIENQILSYVGAKDVAITEDAIVEKFLQYIHSEFMDSSCSCDDAPSGAKEYYDYVTHYLDDDVLMEVTEQEYTFGAIAHLKLTAKDYTLEAHISREDTGDEKRDSNLKGRFKKGSENKYRILGINSTAGMSVGGRGDASKLSSLENDLERMLYTVYMSDRLIDLGSDLDYLEVTDVY